MSCAIVCCAKLEDRYLVEWINYNIKSVGFDAIYIYDNNDDPATTPETLKDLDEETRAKVHIRHEPNNNRLFFRMVGHWMAEHKSKHKAVAFIDPDEFLVLHKHASIHELLEEHLYPHGGALCVNWMMYGSNGHSVYEPGPVTKRFTGRHAGVNPHVKTIAVCGDIRDMSNPHYPSHGTKQRDTSGRVFGGAFNEGGPIDVAQLNHYWTKSFEEWMIKRNKGHIDVDPNHRRAMSLFNVHDKSEFHDDCAWRAYEKIC
jgi:hypothetical protein